MRLRFVLVLLLASAALGIGCARGPSDAALAESINAQIFADQQLKGSSLSVSVNQGVATISGNVSDDSARLEAYKIAAQTPGVKKVDDRMSTAVAAPLQAAEISQPAPVAAPSPSPIAEEPSADRKSKRRATVAANSNPQTPDSGYAADSAPQSAPAAPAESPSADATQPATDASAASPEPVPAPAVAADTAAAAPE